MTVDLYISPFEILKDVSIRMGIPIEKLKSKTRKREIVDARYIYFRRAKEITKASTTKIGEYVNRHHATVIHGIKETFNVPDLIKKYESIYGKTKIETKTLASCSEEANNSRQGERPVLSHDKMEEGITTVPSGKSVMYALLGQWPCNTRRNCGSQGAEKYMQ